MKIFVILSFIFMSSLFAEEAPWIDKFIESYCINCHGPKKKKGGFRIDELPKDFTDYRTVDYWNEVLSQLHSGEMPPEDEKQPAQTVKEEVVSWISRKISEGTALRMAKRGPVSSYRLTRSEYAATVLELLGVHFDANAPGVFNDDPSWHGFERIGSELSLSPSHLSRYMNAAERILSIAQEKIKTKKRVTDSNRLRPKWLDKVGIKERVRKPMIPTMSWHIPGAYGGGLYKYKIKLSGLKSRYGAIPHVSITNRKTGASIYEADVLTGENETVTLEFQTILNPKDQVNISVSSPGVTVNLKNGSPSFFISTKENRIYNSRGPKLIDEDGTPIYPLILVDSIELVGPIVSDEEKQRRTKFFLKMGDSAEISYKKLKEFAEKAWRRPVSDKELQRYMNLVKSEIAAGESLEDAHKTAMIAIMTSRNFFYIIEGTHEKRNLTVNNWEFATRLSYFLTGTMPDEVLFDKARSGNLFSAEQLKNELHRLLSSSSSESFIQDFSTQWLRLKDLGQFSPNSKLYPEYDNWLEESMRQETIAFFREVFTKNLSIKEFLSSDWTFMNSRLADFYGFPKLASSGLQKVKLPASSSRGGLLTQAAVLSLTSDGTRHRPVHRGVWLSEVIFGQTPPPPPPNVDPLVPTSKSDPKATIRSKLEEHSKNPNCASCHKKIDPYGFAFDNFNAIGKWQEREFSPTGKGENPPVNASGELADGRIYNGPKEFKILMIQDSDKFARAFIEHLATFALRRVMTVDDARELDQIVEKSKKKDYRLRDIIEIFITSELFQKR